jgi:uncharacterized protein (TIGR02145 family)
MKPIIRLCKLISIVLITGEIIFLTGCKKEKEVEYGTVIDIDGNSYKTVKIGNQWWMAENLRVTKYQNGTVIPEVTTDGSLGYSGEWNALTSGAYCNYNNNTSSGEEYGKLYNFYAIADSGKLCPANWHVPTNDEWTIMETYLGGGDIAGGKLKENGIAHWESPNVGATNESGFKALPGGYRQSFKLMSGSTFYAIGSTGSWWSSTEYESDNRAAWSRWLHSFDIEIIRGDDGTNKKTGCSVRCVRD